MHWSEPYRKIINFMIYKIPPSCAVVDNRLGKKFRKNQNGIDETSFFPNE